MTHPTSRRMFFRNYDYGGPEDGEGVGPGTGLYHGSMDKYKSVKEFLNKARKRKNPKTTQLLRIAQEFRKLAVFNTFWLDESDIRPDTLSLARVIARMTRASGLYQKNNIYKINVTILDLIKKLFDQIVYQPTHHQPLILNDDVYYDYDDYLYLGDQLILEPFLHDLIHEALDPGISQSFLPDGEDEDLEGNPQYNLNNYYSEHEATYLGGGDPRDIKFGLSKFINLNLREKYHQLEREVSPEELGVILRKYLQEEIANLAEFRQGPAQYLILDTFDKVLYRHGGKIDEEFFRKLRSEIANKLEKGYEKNIPQPIINNDQLAIGNRIRLFFKKMHNLLSSGEFLRLCQRELDNAA